MADECVEFRWAACDWRNSMPHPDELEYLGFVIVREHPIYRGVWLMKRDCTLDTG